MQEFNKKQRNMTLQDINESGSILVTETCRNSIKKQRDMTLQDISESGSI
jgi:hypothetical protein